MVRDSLGGVDSFNKMSNLRVNINGLSDEVNESLTKANQHVVKQGLLTGLEHLILVDTDTGEWCYQEKGQEGTVGWSEFFDFLANAKDGQKFAFVHNHPQGRALSLEDLGTFLKKGNIELVIAAGHNGNLYYAKGKKKKLESGSLMVDLFDVEDDLLKDLRKKLENKQIDFLDFQREQTMTKLKYVIDNYVETYKEVLSPEINMNNQGFDRYMSIFPR